MPRVDHCQVPWSRTMWHCWLTPPHQLQQLLDTATNLDSRGFEFSINTQQPAKSKSVVMGFGVPHDAQRRPLTLHGRELPWAESYKYLGLRLSAGSKTGLLNLVVSDAAATIRAASAKLLSLPPSLRLSQYLNVAAPTCDYGLAYLPLSTAQANYLSSIEATLPINVPQDRNFGRRLADQRASARSTFSQAPKTCWRYYFHLQRQLKATDID
eukprot:Lithocolla_globosa_v1_NODE_778_length_3290_cov_24.418547.p2 type:complete len:212 gc:universal NODE_778_length_3290_cov_24.418547:1498-863(-)